MPCFRFIEEKGLCNIDLQIGLPATNRETMGDGAFGVGLFS